MSPRPREASAPARIAFAGGTLNRAAHLRSDDAAVAALRQLASSRAVLVGAGQQVAVNPDHRLTHAPLSALPGDAELTLLGLDPAGDALFAHDSAHGAPELDPPTSFVPLRELATELEPSDAALAAYAVGMIGWHRVTRYCGRSGDATVVEQAGHRRRCPGCGLLQFPRTDPVITMLVTAGGRCLLSRRRGAPERRWSALAGFMEPGETPEEAIVREAGEETGVWLTGVRYVASQPWPFPAALMLGFRAFADPDDEAALTPEPDELVDARWFERAELRAALTEERIILPPPGTIGNYLITTWLEADAGDAGGDGGGGR
jgi:NAD+ diphosphatase